MFSIPILKLEKSLSARVLLNHFWIVNLFVALAQLERDIIIERTMAGLNSARHRGVQLERKKGLGKEAQNKAMLAEVYYREKKRPIVDIMKQVGIKSKPTLYKYLAIQGDVLDWNPW